MNVSELLDLIASLESSPGEMDGLSELDHALQCAHELSLVRPDDLELQVAGLCHDIGHQFGADEEHGRLGAEAVRPVLGDRIASLVEAHIPAKRYLVYAEGSYGENLTVVSVGSLAVQGGQMSPEEAAAFESDPVSADAVVLRRADEAAKVPDRAVPSLDTWIPAVLEVAQ
jgi:predicted HD phosphohydrolase